MRYKVGDVVKIKTWKDMIEEFGLTDEGEMNIKDPFPVNTEEKLNKKIPDRVLTIRKTLSNGDIYMEEIEGCFLEDDIECLAKDYIESYPITNRFDILDLRR